MNAFTKRRYARVAVPLRPCSKRWNWAKAPGKPRAKKLKKPLTDYLRGKLSDSRRRAPVERTARFQITRDSQTESAAAVRCSALVRPQFHEISRNIVFLILV